MRNRTSKAAGITASGERPSHPANRARQASRHLPTPGKDSVTVFTVGGVGQIGMNWTLYGHAGKWILVDAGSAFAPRDIEGVEAIFPDPAMLAPIASDISAIVVTHAHEDHIGALSRICPRISCPIVATSFAAEILKERFAERRKQGDVKIKIFKPGEKFKVGTFLVETVPVSHSVPECVALALHTSVGTILHTGDWKLDRNPVIGRRTDIAALRRLGDRGVMAMLCDSTNSLRRSPPTSEADIYEGMKGVFLDTDGLVAVSCFASNIARVATVIRAASASGRKVAVSGLSLIRNVAIARKLGMLKGVPPILEDSKDLFKLPRREMALLCTGAQGEERASFSKLSIGETRYLPQMHEGDAVIHSARCIPGNEEDIGKVLDRFREKGVAVHQESYDGHPLHVTGHATAGEIERMYGFVRPRFAIPVHGTNEHMEAHARIAMAAGVEGVAIPHEGDLFRVTQSGIERVTTIPIRLVAELSVGGRFVPWNEAKFRASQIAEAAEAEEAHVPMLRVA